MSNVVVLDGPEKICLSRHGVIEAHAGTGKTYTIVQMVMRILQEPVPDAGGNPGFIHIREIVLVTFTEKAAGELKHRIREGLENRIEGLDANKNEALANHLKDCLNNLHEAFIGTIHGVCLRLLQTWPFETGVPFKTEIVDDSRGLEDALRESIRIDWQDPETFVPWATMQLRVMGMHLEEKHFKLVREVARELLDGGNTVLDRRACGNRRLEDIKNIFDNEYAPSLGEFIACVKKLRAFLENYAPPADFHENAKKSIASAKTWANRIVEGKLPMDVETVMSLSKYKKPDKNGTLRSASICDAAYKKTSQGSEMDSLFQNVQNHRCIASLVAIQKQLTLTLLCDAAELLRDRWERTKEEKGLVSFQDMLRLMHRAVSDNPLFRDALRRRLRYGIIDEFQDTSILQWRIFNRIFLEQSEDNGPRLFIVGDPKQSIYSFQGADVQSYLDAKASIEKKNGQVYGLIHNFRSLPETINGCNVIFGRENESPDWFAFDMSVDEKERISYPFGGKNGSLAQPPGRREGKPAHPLKDRPVQVMALEGSSQKRRADMAAWTSAVIRSLKGKTISVPKGPQWADIRLDYKDFAVIVEAHGLAAPFLKRFQAEGIPAVKYKMEGVFQSAMARDLHALLRAVLHPAGEPAPRLAALLTRFFNRQPAEVDPEKDLEPCPKSNEECNHGKACISHALEEWTYLSSNHRWSQLFSSIQEFTGIRERLVLLADGKRHLADLRQMIEYCVEKLYRDNYSLRQLVEHLGRLLGEEETVGQDENIYTLATEKSSVRVLTMHAAKGLEFPIVFTAIGGSKKVRNAPNMLTWTALDRKKHVAPYLNAEDTDIPSPGEKTHRDEMIAQVTRERRRLLYVALTRAQAMLFVPMHLKKTSINAQGDIAGHEYLDNRYNPDNDLTPRLLHLLEQKKIELFRDRRWKSRPSEKIMELDDHLDPAWVIPDPAQKASMEIRQQIQSLNLAGRICRQTSYSELSRKAYSDRALDRSEGDDENTETLVAQGEQLPPTAIPRGKHTGDAIHLALEELLSMENPDTVHNRAVEKIARQYLERKALKPLTQQSDRLAAVQSAAGIIQAALRQRYELHGKGSVTISSLPKNCRIPEMEFLLYKGRDWVHGYMDLVFRLEKQAKHPWQYFVLDWKSDSLKTFEPDAIETCMKERHYELQAKIYCHALDKYLKGLLGKDYNPEDNLGGALYVFLRSFENPGFDGLEHSYYRKAEPDKDAEFVNSKMGI